MSGNGSSAAVQAQMFADAAKRSAQTAFVQPVQQAAPQPMQSAPQAQPSTPASQTSTVLTAATPGPAVARRQQVQRRTNAGAATPPASGHRKTYKNGHQSTWRKVAYTLRSLFAVNDCYAIEFQGSKEFLRSDRKVLLGDLQKTGTKEWAKAHNCTCDFERMTVTDPSGKVWTVDAKNNLVEVPSSQAQQPQQAQQQAPRPPQQIVANAPQDPQQNVPGSFDSVYAEEIGDAATNGLPMWALDPQLEDPVFGNWMGDFDAPTPMPGMPYDLDFDAAYQPALPLDDGMPALTASWEQAPQQSYAMPGLAANMGTLPPLVPESSMTAPSVSSEQSNEQPHALPDLSPASVNQAGHDLEISVADSPVSSQQPEEQPDQPRDEAFMLDDWLFPDMYDGTMSYDWPDT
ncbi:hypothetical protein DOTSEDRAFT_24725 [Dothistroma septosporum NZE10]|uniref:Uncharacterized protein n=1 Tax=Dothistroma septosporum (strain NZE10 / CBS 128990) TaxID=675120 RepID=N1PQV0_DOTSN|nr:hypothetical protein DOTSEDRAFT_24725 [Dothistroma septosporum NZE10]